ncbi:MAG TPA: hypothetical protein VMV92_27290 [Streptosporangiaceae bacterium]|nr:hypothetical protein [Streptosporangiaceae bacterium]
MLHGIGAYPGFAAASVELKTYEIADRHGGVIRSIDFARLMADYGPTYLTARGTLIRLLREAGGDRVDLRMATTVSALREAGSQVEASLSDGSTGRFDLVVGCGGIHLSPINPTVSPELSRNETSENNVSPLGT